MHSDKLKILIADPGTDTAALVKSVMKERTLIDTAKNGSELLSKLELFNPDLIIVELMLPQIHGIEITRKIKQDPRLKHIDVIIVGSDVMIQNYQAALKAGCNYFLQKPVIKKLLASLLRLSAEGKLRPTAFSRNKKPAKRKGCYAPKANYIDSYLKFWGTRGSNPVSGPDYMRFGGNTSCLEIRHRDTLVIVDAGTGIRPLGLQPHLPKHIHLILGHTHWDHLAGFPFFAPLYDRDVHITIWAPISFEKPIEELFTEMLAHAYFPVKLDDIQAHIVFKEIQEGATIPIDDITFSSHYAFHPGATLCFKFKVGKKQFGYVTDNEFLLGYHGHPKLIGKCHPRLKPYKSQLAFLSGCDFLIHEAQYTPAEYRSKEGWGHSSISNAAVLMRHSKTHQWILTHHDPKHSDMDLLKKIQMQHDIFDELRYECHTRMAFDGMSLPLN